MSNLSTASDGVVRIWESVAQEIRSSKELFASNYHQVIHICSRVALSVRNEENIFQSFSSVTHKAMLVKKQTKNTKSDIKEDQIRIYHINLLFLRLLSCH